MDINEAQPQDTLAVTDEPTSADTIHAQLNLAADAMREWNDWCDTIDERYSLSSQMADTLGDGCTDQRYDLLWSSLEVIKPAIYTRCPKPVAGPKFANKTRLLTTTSEMVERCIDTSFDLGDMHSAMLEVRDDLAMTNRGVLWIRREDEQLCYEHLDRKDFRHEPARKWYDVGWVARRAWMTKTEIKGRKFSSMTDDVLDSIFVKVRKDSTIRDAENNSMVAGIWEVWHKADGLVYWVAEGCDVILERGKPHHDIRGFFPCPKPAYGTLRRRTLVPVPDYFRYAPMLEQINDLTRRIYNLLAWVKMIGLVPGGGDVSEALQASLREHSEDTVIIPVPSGAFSAAGNMVQWMPVAELAQSITGLLEARGVIIQDFYQLSGISDIMRGATEASETLGAQQLKSQYGSVRVRDKINELQRIAKDAACIGGEIIAEEFTAKQIQEMSMMELPTDAEVKKAIRDAEKDAEKEMRALTGQAEEAMTDPEQAQAVQQQLQQAQQQIIEKYAPILRDAENAVTIDEVMKLLRKDRIRGFSIDIETDSTVLTDEITEKQQRAEFLGAFQQAAQSIMQLSAAGESGAALAGGMLKFAMGPYRVGRDLEGMIDDFIEQAPAALAAQASAQGEQPDEGLAAAQMKLAEAEMAKVQAQGQNYQAQAQLKAQELELRGQEAMGKFTQAQEEFRLEIERAREEVSETRATTEKLQAETQEILARIGVPAAKVELDAAKAAADQQNRRTDQQMSLRMHQDQITTQRQAEMAEQQQPPQGD